MNGVKSFLRAVKSRLAKLGFRTGLVFAGVCVICYVFSFAQMALPISLELKGALWIAFFGLAKATQYTAILILGKEGVVRLRTMFKSRV